MEIVVPHHVNDLGFDSAVSTPYVSAPSSPKQFGDSFNLYSYHYSSAPTSPTRAAAIFGWEETSRSPKLGSDDQDDFAFEFSGQLDKGGKPTDLTATADELFEKGKIRPLKPPPGASIGKIAPQSPKSPNRRLWSPRRGDKGFDPFTAAMVEATKEAGPSRSRKGSRSLSPMRSGVAGYSQQKSGNPASAASGTRKWRLRDLLLFRSASEGRVTGNRSKDPIRKYSVLDNVRRGDHDSRNSSFRSTDSTGGSSRGRVSAHEMHYKSNRAVSEEMKKKTALPFNRHGLFDCFRFNPAVSSISRRFS